MGKILTWIGIAILAYLAYQFMVIGKRKMQAQQARADKARSDKNSSAKSTGGVANSGAMAPVALIACAHCGLQLPRDEAVHQGGDFYCGGAHARLGKPADPL